MKVTFFNGSASTSVTTAPQIMGAGLSAQDRAAIDGATNRVNHTGEQPISSVTGLASALDAASGGAALITSVNGSVGDVVLAAADVGAAQIVHSHAWTDITERPTTFAPSAHQHAWADITGAPTTYAPSPHSHGWADVTGKPATFAPSAHAHAIADTTGLQAALDGKQPATTFKTVNGTAITGTGDIAIPKGADAVVVSFATDAEAASYSAANPGAAVFSRQSA